MEPFAFTSLGGKPRTPDPRDHLIGSVSAPVYTFAPTHPRAVQLPYYFQGKQPACGAHSGTSMRVFLNRKDGTNPTESDTPRATWINIKRDGTSPSDGTTMDRIFNTLQAYGAVPFEPLENNVTYDFADYASVKFLTQAMLSQGAANKIGGYAYLTDLSFNGIKQGIDTFGGVLLLIHANAQMWTAPNGMTSWQEKDVLPLRPPTEQYPNLDGHFIFADHYDETYIYGPNSFGTDWGRGGDFYFGADYAPQIIEAGIAHNIPSAVTTVVTVPVTPFTRDLTIGSSGADVKALQNWLIAHGFAIPAGATGYFGPQTQTALIKFQIANGISPAVGYFGPLSRSKISSLGGAFAVPQGSLFMQVAEEIEYLFNHKG
jgi:hypothetical protein